LVNEEAFNEELRSTSVKTVLSGLALLLLLLMTAGSLNASKKVSEEEILAKYLARVQTGQPVAAALSLGKLVGRFGADGIALHGLQGDVGWRFD
jgi:hypothetical protein